MTKRHADDDPHFLWKAYKEFKRDEKTIGRRDAFLLLQAKSPGQYKVSNNGQCVMFRQDGKPKVDFFPSTGNWRVVDPGDGITMHGGAEAFVAWYAQQGWPA